MLAGIHARAIPSTVVGAKAWFQRSSSHTRKRLSAAQRHASLASTIVGPTVSWFPNSQIHTILFSVVVFYDGTQYAASHRLLLLLQDGCHSTARLVPAMIGYWEGVLVELCAPDWRQNALSAGYEYYSLQSMVAAGRHTAVVTTYRQDCQDCQDCCGRHRPKLSVLCIRSADFSTCCSQLPCLSFIAILRHAGYSTKYSIRTQSPAMMHTRQTSTPLRCAAHATLPTCRLTNHHSRKNLSGCRLQLQQQQVKTGKSLCCRLN